MLLVSRKLREWGFNDWFSGKSEVPPISRVGMAILRSDLVRPEVNLLLHSGFCPSLRIYVWFDA